MKKSMIAGAKTVYLFCHGAKKGGSSPSPTGCLIKEVHDGLIVAFGVVDAQVGMAAPVKPDQLLILGSAGRKQLLALFGDGENVLLAVEEQNSVILADLLHGPDRLVEVDIGAGVAVDLQHGQIQHREQRTAQGHHVALEGLPEGDEAAFGHQTLYIVRAVGTAQGKDRRGGTDANTVEPDLPVRKLLFHQLGPGQHIAAFLDSDGVINAAALAVSHILISSSLVIGIYPFVLAIYRTKKCF